MNPERLRCLIFLLIPVANALSESDCSMASTCSECIGASESCVWCSDTSFRGSRCADAHQTSDNCSSQFSENPRGRVVDLTHVQHSPVNQFTPVSAQLELRVGEPQSFRVNVTPAANYPLDLYILMDLSFSMTRYLDNLRGVALSLANALGNVTSQFRIGFGAFNEKLIRPFTLVDNPRSAFAPFRTDFTFRHVVSLTNDTERFREGIAPLTTVTNDDSPEALLDGLLQATVCTNLIGWREESRKLILAFTDQHYHTAGDGRMAGIVRPHDGNCYVERVNSTQQLDYTMSRVLDYPSVGMVRFKLQENDIIPIFASVTEQEETYLELARLIPGAVFQSIGNSGTMASELDPALILQIIEASYNLTSQRVELVPITSSPHLQFSVEATCPMYEHLVVGMSNSSACNEVQIGQTASFQFSVTLTQCPFQQQTFSVRIPGFGKVSVEVSGVCNCPCEQIRDSNSTLCSERGDHTCGICDCHEERFGERCQCDSPEAENLPCRFGLSTISFCSGRGRCECGECLCDEPPPALSDNLFVNASYYGPSCECDNFSCPKGMDNDLICSGRGDCSCERTCMCHTSLISLSPYRGTRCECLPAEEVCLNPQTQLICSGRGFCECAGCRCDIGFDGETCNITVTDMLTCDYDDCVLCHDNVTSSDLDCDALNCTVVFIQPVEADDYFIDGFPAQSCEFIDDSNCIYTYYFIGPSAPIHAEFTDCKGFELPIPLWSVIVIVFGGVLLLGILLGGVVKCVLICLDRRELYRWEKSQRSLDFSKMDNPLYHNPDQKYENVAYKRELQAIANTSTGY